MARDENGKFLPGHVGNPNGRPKMPKHLQNVKKLSAEKVTRIIAYISEMSQEELVEFTLNPATPMVEVTIAMIFKRAKETGDYSAFNFLLDRSIGKVKEVKQIELPKPTIIERLDGSQMLLGAEVIDVEGED